MIPGGHQSLGVGRTARPTTDPGCNLRRPRPGAGGQVATGLGSDSRRTRRHGGRYRIRRHQGVQAPAPPARGPGG
nr:MAG TPA: hypothetical protein [Caudoviricetes sp.]